MPPGVVPIGHFLEKTAIFKSIGEGLCSVKESLFHAKSAKGSSPDQEFFRVVHVEFVVEIWRKIAGIVKMTMKKRVIQRVKLQGALLDFLDLLLKAIL